MFISQHVVDQTREDYLGGISEKTDRPAVHPVHTLWYVGEEMKRALLHVPEHMFHPHAQFGVLPVDGFLPLADSLSSHIAFDDPVLQVVFPHHPLHPLADICAVGMKSLSSITLIHKLFCRL